MTGVFLVVAGFLWFIIFSPLTKGFLNFWLAMALATGALSMLAFIDARRKLKNIFSFRVNHLFAGIGSAFALYALFATGKFILGRIFPSSASQIISVYESKAQAPSWLIGLLLLAWIAPLEEIFWRGCIQRRLQEGFSPRAGYLGASIAYSAVHAFSLNPVLLLSAFVCGLWWGALYTRYKSLWPGIISHALWDFFVFVLFPFA